MYKKITKQSTVLAQYVEQLIREKVVDQQEYEVNIHWTVLHTVTI